MHTAECTYFAPALAPMRVLLRRQLRVAVTSVARIARGTQKPRPPRLKLMEQAMCMYLIAGPPLGCLAKVLLCSTLTAKLGGRAAETPSPEPWPRGAAAVSKCPWHSNWRKGTGGTKNRSGRCSWACAQWTISSSILARHVGVQRHTHLAHFATLPSLLARHRTPTPAA